MHLTESTIKNSQYFLAAGSFVNVRDSSTEWRILFKTRIKYW